MKGPENKIAVPDSVKELELDFAKKEGVVVVDTGPKIGKRHFEIISFFFMLLINQCMRQHLSITLVAMTDTANQDKNIPTFDWKNKNIIHSSFFWGYIGPQVLAGWLITRYGPKWFLITSTTACSITGFLMPWVAVHFGSSLLIACRVVQGFTQCFVVPACACFMSTWVPINERSRAAAFVLQANPLATVVSMLVSGVVSASSYGWPMTFYTFSLLGIVWCAYYTFFGYNSPGEHKSITEEEKTFIINTAIDPNKKKQKTPWKHILTSIPFWAQMYSVPCTVLTTYTLLTQIPNYMNKMMKFNIKSNGLLTSLIYLTQWGVILIMSTLSDYLTNNNYVSVTFARKLLTTIGMMVPSITLLFLGKCTDEDSSTGVILLMIAVGSSGANLCSLYINTVDIAPNHVGVLQGSINGFSHIFALLAPLIVELVVTNEESPYLWNRLFYIISIVNISGAIIFCVAGSAKKQWWNDINEEDGKVV